MAAVSGGLIVGLLVGAGAGVAAANQGITTPGGAILGGDFAADVDLPDLPGVAEVANIDQEAISRARTNEADRIRKRRGRASTINQKKAGILSQGAETTGGLLGN